MKVLKVQGEGHVFAEPDIVTLSFEVEVESTEYARCVGGMNERSENLRESIGAAGLNRKSLKTSSFSVRSINKHLDDKWVFWGYAASQTMSIQLPLEKTLLNTVLNNIAEGHSNAEISLNFYQADIEPEDVRATDSVTLVYEIVE